MKCNFFIISALLILSLFSIKLTAEPSMLDRGDSTQIRVNNRILAKVNGKAISVIDIMKKMDMLFYKQFPEYASSSSARFQFYQANWKAVLQELVNKELVIADAEESKVEISNGDVRQEMEELFGPDIIANIDHIGISFDEASKMVHGDILLRRMIGGRVNARAIRFVTPAQVRLAYDEFIKDPKNQRSGEWIYQTLSFRDKDVTKSEKAANAAYKLLTKDSDALGELSAQLKKLNELGETTTLTISEVFSHKAEDISPANKEIISKMSTNTYSEPVSQKSRDKSIVYRIFFLKNQVAAGIIPFNEVENKLRESLIDKAIDIETDSYIKRLRKHFHVQESVLVDMGDFKPFILNQ